jgi:hypothetical protein
MIGRVQRGRPGSDVTLIRDFLNERMRELLDRRPVWSGLLRRFSISIPDAYSTGGISVQPGSKIATGTGTAWPVNDAVDTTIVDTVLSPGTKWVQVADTTSITTDMVLLVDAAGTPESVSVDDIMQNRISCNFRYAHAGGVTAQASSLNGLQMRVGGYNAVPNTVVSVTSDSTMILDNPWGDAPLTNTGYYIYKAFTTIDPSLKAILLASDPRQGIPISVNGTQEQLNTFDPSRTASGSPRGIYAYGPNAAGNQQYEIYPPQLSAYQINVMGHIQWPDMRQPGDFPPPFINPNVLIYGALATAFSTPFPTGPDRKDPYYNPDAAAGWETKFQQGILDAINADEEKYLTEFTWNYNQMGLPGGANFWQAHDPDVLLGRF